MIVSVTFALPISLPATFPAAVGQATATSLKLISTLALADVPGSSAPEAMSFSPSALTFRSIVAPASRPSFPPVDTGTASSLIPPSAPPAPKV